MALPLFSQGAFAVDANATPEQIAQKRAYIAAMMPRFGSARYLGEGLGQLATGVVIGRQNRKLNEAEGAGRKSAADQFGRLFGTANSAQSPEVQGPMSVLGMTPSQPAPPTDPNTPGAIAGDAMAALGKTVFTPGDRESFINAMMPHALEVSKLTGLDPRVVIAQAAQETGWGKSAPGNNFFGIKSHGKPGGNTFATNEVIDGKTVRINDSFRGYDSMRDSALGYAEFLKENPRYREMLSAGDLEGQIAALGESGYATDPNYASSVRSIATSIGLPEGFTPGQGGAATGAAPAPTSAPAIPINELYMALQNPWMSAEEKGLITSMIQEQQAASDPMRQLELRKAEIELAQLENPTQQPPEDFATRMFTLNALQIDPQSEEGKVYLMTGKLPEPPEPGYRAVTPEEAAARLPKGADPSEYQVSPEGKIEKIGGGGVTVNNSIDGGGKFEEAFAKGDATTIETVYNSGLAAQRNLGRIDQLGALLDANPTGAGAAITQFAGSLGIATEGLDEIQAAQALINSLVPEQRQPGSGPMSDADLALFKQSLPQIINSPGGNKIIVGTMRAIAEYDAEGARIVQRLRSGEITRSQAFDALQNRPNPLEGFKPASKAAAPGGTAAPSTSAPDGVEQEVWDALTPEERALWD